MRPGARRSRSCGSADEPRACSTLNDVIGMGGGHFMMWGGRDRPGEGKRPSIAMYRRLLRIVGLILVLLVRAVVDGVRQFVMAYTGERVIFDLRMEIVRHLQSMSLSFFNRRKTGELMSHVTSDATMVHGVITQTIIQVLGQVLTLVGGVAVIFVMNWRLALLTLVVAPPITVLGQRMGRRIRDISRQAQDAQGEAVGVLQEAIAEVRVVQAFTREEYEAARFREKLVFTFNKTIERARIAATTYPIIGFLGLLSSIIVLWYGGHQVVRTG